MGQTRRLFLVACLLLLGGFALYRVLDADAVPIIASAVLLLGRMGWNHRQARLDSIRRATVQLRSLTAEERSAAIASVSDVELRLAIAAAAAQQGTETRDGAVERFPFPAAFKARAVKRFWTVWVLSAAVLALAAFARDLAPLWRATWLCLGCLLGLHARRQNRLAEFAAFAIEISPFRLSLLGPVGTVQTLSFADGIRVEDEPEQEMLMVRSGELTIPVSYHMIGANRLITLVRTYGNAPSEISLACGTVAGADGRPTDPR